MKYKVGDKVVINKSIIGDPDVVVEMKNCAGHICEIKGIDPEINYSYIIYTPDKSDYWFYKEEWFDPINVSEVSVHTDSVPTKIKSYTFKGKVNYSLLCREAFTDGLYAFVLVEPNCVCIAINALINMTEYNFRGDSIKNYCGYTNSGYVFIPFERKSTSSLLSLARNINKQEAINVKEMKKNVRIGNDKSIINKVIY